MALAPSSILGLRQMHVSSDWEQPWNVILGPIKYEESRIVYNWDSE